MKIEQNEIKWNKTRKWQREVVPMRHDGKRLGLETLIVAMT